MEKFTLITGGSEGIGFELAKQFAKNAHNLIIIGRNTDRLNLAKTELDKYGVKVIAISKDLFIPEAPFELFDEIKLKGYRIEILVNNAGQGVYGLF